MAIDYRRLLDWPVPEVRQTYSVRDSQLYALAVGLGADPVDTRQLPFVYEQNPQALPTQAVVLGYPGFWMKDPATGVDWVRLVHAEQGLRLHRPLPASGEVIGRTRVVGINDKGPGKGAIVYSQRTLHDAASDALIATLDSSTFCRGDGGCGGSDAPPMRLAPTPERAPDTVCELPTLPQQALLYRQCGDFNPLHADPAVARAAGFERPILHGLCTFAVAGHALLRTLCDYDPARLTQLQARFSAPVYPGETLRTEIWHEAESVAFRTLAVERNVVVLSHGRAHIERT
ncbi:MaoC/PaaZ C-terminal domain-containing protein [Immundisolibacter cernigliae]|uniref:3-alpha,7-alpha, 12-alpha-trihydroxy-5-beta-cholest-24-enoyl-CoA hydratase n=1 Tax=Immundisolibacter cernigliae TaxID=1810504 RepID=A0A1B1YQJ8_9GAMM|nr:MaoC/PaaZ C-terminal domain-containing protein [Immundisolibacter cernigliae]ANX03046.1 3-alpha,7-alpha,12-alpha-trihydroxy-5-beta-cholest-24-enoyl-CoA hydratase [Immundisolibacter cernigliae]